MLKIIGFFRRGNCSPLSISPEQNISDDLKRVLNACNGEGESVKSGKKGKMFSFRISLLKNIWKTNNQRIERKRERAREFNWGEFQYKKLKLGIYCNGELVETESFSYQMKLFFLLSIVAVFPFLLQLAKSLYLILTSLPLKLVWIGSFSVGCYISRVPCNRGRARKSGREIEKRHTLSTCFD